MTVSPEEYKKAIQAVEARLFGPKDATRLWAANIVDAVLVVLSPVPPRPQHVWEPLSVIDTGHQPPARLWRCTCGNEAWAGDSAPPPCNRGEPVQGVFDAVDTLEGTLADQVDNAKWPLVNDALDTLRAALAGESKPVESRGGVPTVHGDRCDAGVHAAISQTYVGGERADESLLRIRRWLKEPRGWWNPQDEENYAAALSNNKPKNRGSSGWGNPND